MEDEQETSVCSNRYNDHEENAVRNRENGLKREINLLGAVTMYVGIIIGSGIFISPTVIAARMESTGGTLLVWTGCGVLSMLGALIWIELGTMFPNSSGGDYTYLYEAFGPLPAFVYAFVTVTFVEPTSLCLISLTCGKYIITAFHREGNQDEYAKLIAACVIGIVLLINCFGVKLATGIQTFFTAAKMIAIAILIITGLVRLGQGYDSNFKNAFNGTNTAISDIGLAFYGGSWAYSGWNNLNLLNEELKNPIRDLPLAIIIGVPLVTFSYVMVNIGYLTVMTPSEIATSKAVAVTLGYQIYGKMAWIIPFLVACSTFGAANGTLFTYGRLLHVCAREGHMPKLLGMVHKKRHTPIPALWYDCIIAWILLIPKSSTVSRLIGYFGFSKWLLYALTISAMLWLRYKKRDLKRPFKVFIGIPIFVLLCSVYLVVAPFYSYPLESFYVLLVILVAIPLYFAFVRFKILPAAVFEFFDNISDKLESWCNLALPDGDYNNLDKAKEISKKNEKEVEDEKTMTTRLL